MDTKELTLNETYKQIAMRRVIHTPVEDIMSEFNLSRGKLYRILANKEYKAALKELSEESSGAAVLAWKASMSDLIREAHRALKERLKDNDLKAVEIVLKSIGVDAQEVQQQSTSITVMLPDLNQGKTIEVEGNEIES